MTTLKLKTLSALRTTTVKSSPQYRPLGGHDFLIVGAGFAGCVIAERLASQLDRRVLLVDKRDHVGGTAHDCLNADGIMIHRYGPHLFHTNSQRVMDYLSKFTDWRAYKHRVLANHAENADESKDADNQYLQNRYQCMPTLGFTRMFERMIDHPNIDFSPATDFADVRANTNYAHVVYTGSVDEYFGHCYGRLPYRSLRFEHRTLDQPRFQSTAFVNYSSLAAGHTRITEYKHITGQVHPKTTISHEFPADMGDPCYPILTAESAALYRRYKELAERTPGITFTGRLGTYRYCNMDQVVAQSLTLFNKFAHKMGVSVDGACLQDEAFLATA